MRPAAPRSALVRLLAVLTVLALAGAAAAASPAAEKRVVRGSDGWLFIAQDWSVPCQYHGAADDTAARMQALVQAVERSGRPTTVLLGPDKGSMRAGNLPEDVPLRSCGDRETAAVRAAMARRLGDHTLDLRHDLAGAGARYQVYWRQDTHWTPVGGVVLARALAARLDPVLARRLQTVPATYTRHGDLADVLGIPGKEKVQGLQLVNPGVTVKDLPRGDAGIGMGSRHSMATPTVGTEGRVVPGRTLFIGDSFVDTAVAQLAPLFHDATYLWPDGETDPQDLVRKVQEADRVVVLRVERFSSQWRPYDADVVQAMRGLEPRVVADAGVRR